MSYQAGFMCVDKPYQVAQYIAEKHIGEFVKQGDSVYSTSLVELSDERIVYLFTHIQTGETFYSKLPFSLTECFFPMEDALNLAWMVIGVWVVMFAIRMLLRTLNPHGDLYES
jgi:hypothetical protein